MNFMVSILGLSWDAAGKAGFVLFFLFFLYFHARLAPIAKGSAGCG
jgi:hypothetical protein